MIAVRRIVVNRDEGKQVTMGCDPLRPRILRSVSCKAYPMHEQFTSTLRILHGRDDDAGVSLSHFVVVL